MSGRKGGEAKVEQVAVEARRLVTIGIDSPFWEGKPWHHGVQLRGAIVRVQPPAAATDGELALLGTLLAEAGAAKVRFDSRAQADALPTAEQQLSARASAREVVMEMGSQSQRAAELKPLLDLELAKVRL